MTKETIVVGVDGSPSSQLALEWAVQEALLRKAQILAVHAWQFPAVGMTAYGGAALPVLSMNDLEKAEEALARRAIEEVMGDRIEPPAALVVRVGNPAAILLDVAKDADLLVVGSRGHGGFSGMLLGSVSNHVVHHASCPVVVIRRPAH
jgi:nucleotide-binding universal stress UspA family protein